MFPRIRRKKVKATPRTKPYWHHEISRLSDEELATILRDTGSKRLEQITKKVKKYEKQQEQKKKARIAKLKPHLEHRSELDRAINETILNIRRLPPEAIATQGIGFAKNLYEQLKAMQASDETLNALGHHVTYSYRPKDLHFESTRSVINFLDSIRAGKIFRSVKRG